MDNNIKCPACGKLIAITEALKQEFEKELGEKYQKDLEIAQKQVEEKSLLEINELKKILEEKERKNAELREQEIKLQFSFQRKLDEERKRVEETVMKHATENFRLKEMEREKVISDLKKSLEEAQRKASQGSQQTQGEVLELDLENTLRVAFPNDQIEPVEKGIKGADIRQIVKSPRGTVCGVILWESKRTKAWTDEWLVKLKDDLRAVHADIPVIVSTVLPKEAENGFGLKEGVWLVTHGLVIPLAIMIRKNLLDVGYQKALSINQGRKADLVYDFITGNEFRQQVESLVEVFKEMQDQLFKEKTAFEKIWKSREGQIRRLISGTVNIYGGAQGLVGSSMPQIKGLELLE